MFREPGIPEHVSEVSPAVIVLPFFLSIGCPQEIVQKHHVHNFPPFTFMSKFMQLHSMFNTCQVAGLSTLDGPFSPCHAPESALGLDLSPGSSFYFFQTLVSTSLT